MAQDPTVVAPPDTNTVAQQILASMSTLSGVITDFNIGSQIRTQAESLGAVAELQGISNVTLALQTIAFSAMSLFNIIPRAAVPAVGNIVFSTAVINPPPISQSVIITQGTLLQTIGGIKFATTQTATMVQGASAITIPIQAVDGGIQGNVPRNSITQILNGPPAALVATNIEPTIGGLNAETASQALTRLAAVISSLVGGSPISVANAAIGVTASASNEAVVYSTCFEPWTTVSIESATPGFEVYVDDGSGSATTALASAVTDKLNGDISLNLPSYRPSGVPFTVGPGTPVLANVAVSGTAVSFANLSSVSNNITRAVSKYFTLPFNTPAEQTSLAAAVGNAALGQVKSLRVYLEFVPSTTSVGGQGQIVASPLPGPYSLVNSVSAAPNERVILNDLSLNFFQLSGF